LWLGEFLWLAAGGPAFGWFAMMLPQSAPYVLLAECFRSSGCWTKCCSCRWLALSGTKTLANLGDCFDGFTLPSQPVLFFGNPPWVRSVPRHPVWLQSHILLVDQAGKY
jgi:hypothetical protein